MKVAAGGGMAQVVPMATSTCTHGRRRHCVNNLPAAPSQPHPPRNEQGIDVWRIMLETREDMNDRALRRITAALGGPATATRAGRFRRGRLRGHGHLRLATGLRPRIGSATSSSATRAIKNRCERAIWKPRER
jgi:hypothetical protein